MSVKLHKSKEFDKRVHDLLKDYPSKEQAYQAVEVEYYMTFGHTKYQNYESYRTSRRHRRKAKV